jgi:transposase
LAVAKIVKSGRRQRSKMFAELQSHYLFDDRFGRPGKGNDKIPWGLPPAMLPVLARSAIEELIMEANVCNREPSLSNSVEEAAIFVSIELSRARWLVTSLSPNTNKFSRHSVPGSDIAELLRLLGELRAKAERRINAGVRIICIQEIGFDGFWIHRVLESNGIESHVVESASIAVSRRHRRAKTDAIDGELLLRTLMAFKRGEPRVCAMVVVPTPEDEDRRRLSRERKTMVKERIEHINRIKGLMASQGIVGFEPMRSKSRDLLDNLRTGDGRPLPERMKAEITRELKRLELLRKQIAEIEAERDALLRPCETTEPSPGAQLLKLRGIGPEFASVVWQEGLYRQFANRRQLAAYAGLAPSPWQSGDMNKEQGIAKSGNPRLRTTMIEAAWLWLRHQPKSALTLWFQNRVKGDRGRHRRIAIVALARKLLIALWRFATLGEIPEGATLKIA